MKILAFFLVIFLGSCSSPNVVTPPPIWRDGVAVQVPGHPGFFYSPYSLGNPWIDATGLASGARIKCPVSGKVIVIP